MLKPNGVIKVNTSLDDFFTSWLLFLRPFHRMTERQVDFAAHLLKHYYELSKVISDTRILNQQVLGPAVRQEVLKECGINAAFYRVLVRELVKHRFIVDGAINPKYVPKLSEGLGSFSLMLYFDIK